MALPKAPEARRFWQAAKQRLRDAEILLEQVRTTGAVYLAGYAVECVLKALLLNATSKHRRKELEKSFRTAKAHNYDWLIDRYRRAGGPSFPLNISRHLSFTNTWTTSLRYQAASLSNKTAVPFLEATRQILGWVEGRF